MGEDVLVAGKRLAKPIEPLSTSERCKAPLAFGLFVECIPQSRFGPIPDRLG